MKKLMTVLIAVFISIAVNAQSNTNTYRYPLILGIRATAPVTGGALILNGLTSGSATIQVPAIAGTGTIFQLPATNGTSGYVLRTDGAGVLTWVKPDVAVSDTAAMLSKYSLKLNATFTGTHNLYGGVTVGPFATANKATITSAILTGTTVALYNGATQYSVGVAPADQVTGVALADSSKTDGTGYTTPQDLGVSAALKINKADSTGNASGNYMTRQNYHNDPSKVFELKNLQAFGCTIKALPLVGSSEYSSSSSCVDASQRFTLIYISEKSVITGIGFTSNLAGVFTPDSLVAMNGVAFYKVDETLTTATKVDSSANNANIWRHVPSGIVEVPFVSTYTAAPGFYYISTLFNSSSTIAAPKIYSLSSSSQQPALLARLPSGRRMTGLAAGRATFIPSIALSAMTTSAFYSFVYCY
jgi:hypothetical protein